MGQTETYGRPTLAHMSFKDIGFRDVCFLLNTMELHGTRLVVLKEGSMRSHGG